MINSEILIDMYFDKDFTESLEKVTIANDKELVLYFCKSLATKLNGSVRSSSFRNQQYYYYSTQSSRTVSKKFLKIEESYFWEVEIVSGGSLLAKSEKGCSYLHINDSRRSLKVDDVDDSVTINLKWLIPHIKTVFNKVKDAETEKKVVKFQNELLIPWMYGKILDECGIPSELITSSTTEIVIKNFTNRTRYSRICISPDYKQSVEDFEDKLWNLTLKREMYSKIKVDSIVKILQGFSDSGSFKSIK